MAKIKTIAFDADDTLWVNETIFKEAQEKCKSIAAKYVDREQMETRLYEVEIRNLQHFGYGIKGFILSVIETLIELSQNKLTNQEIQEIIDLGRSMREHPVHLLDGVSDTIQVLKDRFELMIITKGDLLEQESKIARSGLADMFDKIEILSDKTPQHYKAVFNKHMMNIDEFLMVGNSLKSDIIPICELGGQAVHIPFHTTWEYEVVETHVSDGYDFKELKDITLLPDYLNQMDH